LTGKRDPPRPEIAYGTRLQAKMQNWRAEVPLNGRQIKFAEQNARKWLPAPYLLA
jgi:hypothetical protein